MMLSYHHIPLPPHHLTWPCIAGLSRHSPLRLTSQALIRHQWSVFDRACSLREDQPPISREDIVKGYEFEKERYVVIDKEDIDKITPKTSTEMQIVEFVRLSEIDPVYFETSYYVSPEGAGEKPYALLFEALRTSGLCRPRRIRNATSPTCSHHSAWLHRNYRPHKVLCRGDPKR
jgi:hypothetical protein